MLTPNDILTLSKKTQRQTAFAIRLAALLLERGKSITEREAKAALKVDDLAWAETKAALADVLGFQNGRVGFDGDVEKLAPWDLVTDEQVAKVQKRLKKRIDAEAIELTPLQQSIFELGGFTRAQSRAFAFSQGKIYGYGALEAAVKVAVAAKPAEPRSYIISVMRRNVDKANAIPAAHVTNGASRFPLRIRNFERQANPESGKTVFVGWEAPQSVIDGEPIWETGIRRKIWRLTTGILRLEQPAAGEAVPSLQDDPGCIIIK